MIFYKLLGTREWFVIHHTNCGMETFTDEVMRGLLAQSLEAVRREPHAYTVLAAATAVNVAPYTLNRP